MSDGKPSTASAAALAIVELLPESQAARHLLTAVNRHTAMALAASVEQDHALNVLQDLILTFTGPMPPDMRSQIEALVECLEKCSVCQRAPADSRRFRWPTGGNGLVN